MKKTLFALSFLAIFLTGAKAQIINGLDTLYGNEWIDFDQSYFKIMVAEDGIYRVSHQVLSDANLPLGQINGNQFQLFHNGEEVPIYLTTDGPLGSSDYIEFFGQKNTSELDRYLFKDPDAEMMNPLYSLFTDTAAYFLTWKTVGGGNQRYETIVNDLTNLPAKEGYFMAAHVLNYFSDFSKKSNSQNISSSDYGVTEGYSNAFANEQTITINPPNPYAGGPDGQLDIRYGSNIGSHQQLITLNGQPLVTDEFSDFQVRQLNFDIPNAQFLSALLLKFQGLASTTDRQRVANVILRYPALYKFSNQPAFFFDLPAASAVRYLEIENFNASGGDPVLYDLNNLTRMAVTYENGLVKIALPPSAEAFRLVLVNDATGVKSIGQLIPVSFIDYAALNAEFIILSNPKLYDDGNGNNHVQEYADYRSSATGGGYSTVIVDVQQVYDQFGWGLNRHPLSIRDFGHFVKKHWAGVKYFFVVGKGREYPNVRLESQLASTSNASYYIPTFGVPGSDNLLLAGSDGFTPVIPVGRIAASSAEDVRIYLDKVKQFEANRDLPQTIVDRAWMKKVLHLGGGSGVSEQTPIRNYLGLMENTLERSHFGAEVKSFFKTSIDPIQIPQTQQLLDYINDGISILTFFGHSSVGVFDFSFDDPSNYQNAGKYPLMLSLGCYSGNFHTSGIGVSEKFVLVENKGTIAFGATSGQGYISSLFEFTNEFYRLLGDELYGEGLGDALRKTIENKPNGGFGVDLIRQQFNFHGDPALRLNSAPGPDYVVNASTVKFFPEQVTAQLDSFDVKFSILNLGSQVSDSIFVQVTQQLPSGLQEIVLQDLIPSPGFTKELAYKISSKGKDAVGQNRFFIKVDASNKVDEKPLPTAETNNELVTSNGEMGIVLFITDIGALAVYPPEFAIVSAPDVMLKATTLNPLISSRKYLIEIDTSEIFNSAILSKTEIMQSGGILKWKPPVDWQDGQVYYWRVSPDSLSPQQGYIWNNSSFVYLTDIQEGEGWNQSHFFQIRKNDFVNVQLLTHENLDFITSFKDFTVRNCINTVEPIAVYFNNYLQSKYFGVPDAGIYLMWLDSVFVYPHRNYPIGQGVHYGYNYPVSTLTYIFETSTADKRKELVDFLTDVVGPNDHVLLWTVQPYVFSDYKPQEWANDSLVYGKNLFQILEAQGAQQVRQLETAGSLPYVFAYKKSGGVYVEQLADSLTEVINLYFSIHGNWDRGSVGSPLIGPASKWSSIVWQTHSDGHPEADTVLLQVYGVSSNGVTDSLLLESPATGTLDISAIETNEFPYLKLKFNSEDSIFRTSARLDFWRVLYDGVPEFAVNPASIFMLKSDTIQQGEPLSVDFAIENLSNNDGDSLLLKYTWRDKANNETSAFRRLAPLVANDSLIAHISLNSTELADNYQLSAEVNPAYDQPEQTHLNNFLNTGFFVETDKRNPLLDVTFDGTHILDGDLVSAKPHIVITLKDENKYLTLEDTSFFKLFLLYPDSTTQPVLVPFSDPAVLFMPASGNGQNKATIEYAPVFTRDGKYQLVVQARDATGNAAGQFDYKVSFQVITKSMISNLLNYPNPFSTATHFVYTLTGSEPPARLKIQIMTVSGRIVREITQDEIGPLQIGTHKTDFAWDGRDEFGDRLANGVYLYQVLVQDQNGKRWEKFETGADRFFEKGMGKMVILR